MILIFTIGIATGCVYGLIAVGYSVIYRTTGVVNFAQGGYVVVAALATSWSLEHAGAPYPIAILIGTLASALLGAILWFGVVRPLWRVKSPSHVLLIGTVAFVAVVSNIASLVFGVLPQRLPRWLPFETFSVGAFEVSSQYAIVIAVSSLLMIGIELLLKYSTIGISMRACATNREMSELLGISPERMGMTAFIATAALGGFGGTVIAAAQPVTVDLALTYGVFGFVAAVIGGFGSVSGAFAGGIILGVINATVAAYISSSYQTVIAFSILLLLLAARPQGIFGKAWEGS
jgi:branched-chain amino acid transport system permease protein